MFNKTALLHAMVDAECSATELAQACGLSRSAFYRRMAGAVDFTVGDVDACSARLGLDPTRRDQIFFEKKVS